MTAAPIWEPPPETGSPPPKPPRKRRRRTALIIAGSALGAFAIVTGIGLAAESPSGTPTAHPSASTSLYTGAIPQPTLVPSAPVAPPAPSFTVEQQQAIDSAQGYLDMGTGFSKAGLYKQLTSSYGEGFSPSLARFAIRHLDVNWNEQAVLSAKGYLESGGGFSYAGLVEQLHSPYGEDFTLAQAQHGATVALRG